MLFNTIQSDLTDALKAGDREKVETLRFLVGDIQNFRISKTSDGKEYELKDEDVVTVLSKQVKTHKESIEMFKTGNRQDLVDREQAQLLILQSYLPEQMDEQGVRDQVL